MSLLIVPMRSVAMYLCNLLLDNIKRNLHHIGE